MAQQKILIGTVKGEPGLDGRDAKIVSATATADGTHLEMPTVTVDVGGEPGAQTMAFNFTGLQGPPGEAGPSGSIEYPGTADQLILGDGSTVAIDDFVETIREKLGVFTETQNGLVPKSGA